MAGWLVVANSSPTVVMVEDEQWIAEIYKQQLESAGCRVYVAPEAQSAIDIIDEYGPISLVMLDLFLPEHNGFSVLQHLQSYDDWQKIPVVIFSSVNARDVSMSEEEWERYGVVWYAEKHNVHPKEVTEKVKAIIYGESSTN